MSRETNPPARKRHPFTRESKLLGHARRGIAPGDAETTFPVDDAVPG